MVWTRFGEDKTLPLPNVIATTADVKVTEFILTPRVGYQLLDQEKIRIGALQDSDTGTLGRICSLALRVWD